MGNSFQIRLGISVSLTGMELHLWVSLAPYPLHYQQLQWSTVKGVAAMASNAVASTCTAARVAIHVVGNTLNT